ncbi:MAG: hypothetical protein WCF92_03710 [bacterium]
MNKADLAVFERMFEIVKEEREQKNLQETLPPTETREWRPGSFRELIWTHPMFGTLVVKSQYALDESVYAETNVRAEVILRENAEDVKSLGFAINVTADENVSVLSMVNDELTDLTNQAIPDLVVPIETRTGKSNGVFDESGFPSAKNKTRENANPTRVHVRNNEHDNMEVVLFRPDGKFVELQISVTTRRGIFWVAIQELYCGQMVRTTEAKANQIGLTSFPCGHGLRALVAPLYAENAYPGADYLMTFKAIGPQLVAFAVMMDAFTPLSRCAVAKWEPEWLTLPEEFTNKRFQMAVVDWFNLLLGCGKATLENGDKVFIYFNAIEDEYGRQIAQTGFPSLDPYGAIMVRTKESEPGKAKIVRPMPVLVEAN